MNVTEKTTCTTCKREFPKAYTKCPFCKTKNKNKPK